MQGERTRVVQAERRGHRTPGDMAAQRGQRRAEAPRAVRVESKTRGRMAPHTSGERASVQGEEDGQQAVRDRRNVANQLKAHEKAARAGRKTVG